LPPCPSGGCGDRGRRACASSPRHPIARSARRVGRAAGPRALGPAPYAGSAGARDALHPTRIYMHEWRLDTARYWYRAAILFSSRHRVQPRKDARSSPSRPDASWMFLGIRAGPLILLPLRQVSQALCAGKPNSMAEMHGGAIQAPASRRFGHLSGSIGSATKDSLPSFKDLGCFLVVSSSQERQHHIAARACRH
jgi:hypothetical protein